MMKLTYFDGRGRAEPARLLLALGKEPYEYEAVSVQTWQTPEGKAHYLERTPFGQLPLLEDGVLRLCQSRAINRYLARKLGLYGDTLEEQARVDEVTETVDELMMDIALMHWNPQFHEKRAEHRDAMRKKLELLNVYFARTRADAEHWVLPGRYTLADVMTSYVLESLIPMHPGLIQEFPALEHAAMTFFQADGVREYVRSDRRCRTWTISLAVFAGTPEQTHQFT